MSWGPLRVPWQHHARCHRGPLHLLFPCLAGSVLSPSPVSPSLTSLQSVRAPGTTSHSPWGLLPWFLSLPPHPIQGAWRQTQAQPPAPNPTPGALAYPGPLTAVACRMSKRTPQPSHARAASIPLPPPSLRLCSARCRPTPGPALTAPPLLPVPTLRGPRGTS